MLNIKKKKLREKTQSKESVLRQLKVVLQFYVGLQGKASLI